MYLDLYRGADPDASFSHFEKQRKLNVEYLRTLPRSAGDRRAHHKAAGEFTLQQMLHAWACLRARTNSAICRMWPRSCIWQKAGPLSEDYKLKP